MLLSVSKDVQRFYRVLGKRLNKFKLELSEEKTRMLKFTRYETRNSKMFTFLGFEYWWGKSRDGKPLVMMQTSKKKFRAAMRSITDWLKAARSRLLTSEIFEKLRQKLQGHWNYYGVRGNYRMLSNYYHKVLGIMFKWLNRRSQRRSCNWTGFEEMLTYYRIPRPRIIGYWN